MTHSITSNRFILSQASSTASAEQEAMRTLKKGYYCIVSFGYLKANHLVLGITVSQASCSSGILTECLLKLSPSW